MSRIAKTLKLGGLPVHRGESASVVDKALGALELDLEPGISVSAASAAPPTPQELLGEGLGKALGRRPVGIFGKGWSRKDESQYEAVRNSCVAKKPRCETKFSKGKRVRKCYRDCERVAAATVNKQRKADGRAPAKKRKRSQKR